MDLSLSAHIVRARSSFGFGHYLCLDMYRLDDSGELGSDVDSSLGTNGDVDFSDEQG